MRSWEWRVIVPFPLLSWCFWFWYLWWRICLLMYSRSWHCLLSIRTSSALPNAWCATICAAAMNFTWMRIPQWYSAVSLQMSIICMPWSWHCYSCYPTVWYRCSSSATALSPAEPWRFWWQWYWFLSCGWSRECWSLSCIRRVRTIRTITVVCSNGSLRRYRGSRKWRSPARSSISYPSIASAARAM